LVLDCVSSSTDRRDQSKLTETPAGLLQRQPQGFVASHLSHVGIGAFCLSNGTALTRLIARSTLVVGDPRRGDWRWGQVHVDMDVGTGNEIEQWRRLRGEHMFSVSGGLPRVEYTPGDVTAP
jgi:hypothetical protein